MNRDKDFRRDQDNRHRFKPMDDDMGLNMGLAKDAYSRQDWKDQLEEELFEYRVVEKDEDIEDLENLLED